MPHLEYPLCFPDAYIYEQWRRIARTAHEPATPCDDCTAKYAHEQGPNCQRRVVRANFGVFITIQPAKESS